MRQVVLNYPHYSNTMEPQRLKAAEIWDIASAARDQIAPGPALQLDLTRLVARVRNMKINGLVFSTQWDVRDRVVDDRGRLAMGVVEFDETIPDVALISISGEVIGERDDIARSTSAHELAHAVFDVPAWIKSTRRRSQGGPADPPLRRYRRVSKNSGYVSSEDWAERRANEFMGAFLAPPRMIHRAMLRTATALDVPLTSGADGTLVLDPVRAGSTRLQAVADELAPMFGLSLSFIETRLTKYRFVKLED